ncbi:hypothetical protein ncot_04310 [Nocardioides sp. JQ2195]|uniref:hypothetical protein n=1 Tax=Nocardioides sp. JQ2195 TaxID=2592334 RepID=UPI00143EBA3E|nr:hypothetical protein [Nocardioides sp. JQ2195]QIX25908.1 hypothetical protein ncot_04310 [Nocardioides sp. JQ2195]
MDQDDLARIHEELAKDGVFVHPSLADLVTPADEAALEQEAARAEHPTYVVVWPLRESDTYGGKASDLLTRLHDEYPEPGIYLSTTTRLEPTDHTSVEVDGRQWGIPGEADGDLSEWAVEMVVDQEEHQDIPSAMGRTLELLDMDPDQVAELNDELLAQGAATRGDGPEDDDGWLPGGLTTVLVAALAVFVAWRVAVSFRRKPAPLPKSAMRRIRAARARELLARARDESQALGEQLDQAEIEPGDDADSWQAALDHYAVVRRLLTPDEPAELDVVGALVLTQRGREAFACARGGKAWQPTATCYLNPLHGQAGRGRRIEWQGRTLEVPVCDECREALRRKKVPDILDVVHKGRPVHYFETEVEPWASTGYGALEPDLMVRLHDHR